MRTRLGFLVALTLGLASPLFAVQDAKFYSGAACHPVWGTDTSTYEYYGILYNTSSANPLVVSCDVLRDTTNVSIVFLETLDNHPGADISCTFVVKNHYGTWTSVSTNSSSGTGRQEWWVGSPGDAYYGTYSMQCTIPPVYNGYRSGIEIIGVTETE